jgi:hypothetical protein
VRGSPLPASLAVVTQVSHDMGCAMQKVPKVVGALQVGFDGDRNISQSVETLMGDWFAAFSWMHLRPVSAIGCPKSLPPQ